MLRLRRALTSLALIAFAVSIHAQEPPPKVKDKSEVIKEIQALLPSLDAEILASLLEEARAHVPATAAVSGKDETQNPSSAASRDRVVVLDFTSNGVSPGDARTVSEIFKSKLIVAGIYDVLDRTNINAILGELEIQSAGLTESADALRVGTLLDARYLVSGSLMKLGSRMAMSVKLVDVATGAIIKTADTRLSSLDEVDARTASLVEALARASLKKPTFTLLTRTTGWSLELGGGYYNFSLAALSDKYGVQHFAGLREQGGTLSFGLTMQDGNHGTGGTALFAVQPMHNLASGGFNNSAITYARMCGLGLSFFFGDKVTGTAFDVGMGGFYDFNLGVNIVPRIGLYYHGFFARFYPAVDLYMLQTPLFVPIVEAGYSIFLGSRGKQVVEFK